MVGANTVAVGVGDKSIEVSIFSVAKDVTEASIAAVGLGDLASGGVHETKARDKLMRHKSGNDSTFFILPRIIRCSARATITVCVAGAGAGVDSAWYQENSKSACPGGLSREKCLYPVSIVALLAHLTIY